MRHKLLVGLFVGAATWCGVTAEGLADWRAPWKITLDAQPDSGVPDALLIRVENDGTAALVGTNVVFNLTRDSGFYGWAIDPVLRAERLELLPGSVVERTSRRSDLIFLDLRGREIPKLRAENELAMGRWEIAVTLLDMATPKPTLESSFLVWSNTVTFGGSAD